MTKNTEALARAVFSRVGLRPSDSHETVTLRPKLVGIVRSRGVFAWEDSATLLMLEWTVTDRRGSLVWKETIVAESVGGSQKDQIDDVIGKVFSESHTRILNASTIRSLQRSVAREARNQSGRGIVPPHEHLLLSIRNKSTTERRR